MNLKRLTAIILVINLWLFIFGNIVLANDCPTDDGHGVGCTGGTYYCGGSCITISSCPSWDPGTGPICATQWDSNCTNCSSTDPCGVCNSCSTGYSLCGAYPASRHCEANDTPPDNCKTYNQCTHTCTACNNGYYLSGNQCVQAVLKLGPDSVSGNTIVQSAANTLMYISGDKVNIGTSSFATGTKLYLYDVASGPIIALSGLDSNYRGLTIKNTNDAEQWFIGNNASNNFVIRANSSNDILIVNASTSNVGIGTTTPGAKLDVNGSLAVRGSISFTGPSYIGASSRLLMVDNEGNVSATTTLAGVSMPTGATGQTLRYGASAWEATSTIYIKNDGNVGIGKTSPGAKLDVLGGIRISSATSYAGISTDANGSIYFGPSNGQTYFNAATKNNAFYAYDSSVGSP